MADDAYDDWPDCLPCGDTGREGRRRCPDCDPGPISYRWWLLTWRLRLRIHLARDRVRARDRDNV